MIDLSKYPYQRQVKVYRLYKAGLSPVKIARECHFNDSTFVRSWPTVVGYLIKKFETPKIGHKPKGFRKVKIDAHILKDIFLYASVGRNVSEIASLINVSIDTLIRYQRENPKIKDAILNGHKRNIAKIEDAMSRLAQGKCVIKKKRYFAYQGRVLDERDETVEAFPDTQAAQLVLVNKAGWRSGSSTAPTGEGDRGRILEFIEAAAAAETTDEVKNGSEEAS